MALPKLSLVVAMAQNGVIGKGGKLPWKMPSDLTFFKKTTLHHPIIMGRKTWETFPGVLEKRENIVLTRQAFYEAKGAKVVSSFEKALEGAGATRVMVIGGVAIFEAALPIADTIWLTEIHEVIEGDRTFDYDRNNWKEVSRIDHPKDRMNPYPYSFVKLVRD